MTPGFEFPRAISRRQALQTVSSGFGWLAFSSLLQAQPRESNPLAPRAPHFTPKAKRVIFLCMQGAPSHMDTFDYKPKLIADAAKSGRTDNLVGCPHPFVRQGDSGLWISSLFPELGKHADSLCLLRSLQTDIPNHPQAFTMLHTGSTNFVRPSLGSWVLYGLGKETENLPGFISLNAPAGNTNAMGSAFLPAVYQGMRVGTAREGADAAQPAVPNIKNPVLSPGRQRRQLDFVQGMNQDLLKATAADSEVEAVIQSYEQAFKMQTSVPGVMDLSRENASVLQGYGIGAGASDSFGRQCLLARKLVESGVRFVEVTHPGWDHHNNLKERLEKGCSAIDKPIAGLLQDLKERGMLADTLVLWGGEFGRTPDNRGGDGRNHNAKGFAMWMAGGGVRGGFSYGATDDHGRAAVENPMHIHDLHATILSALGLDHERLTYPYAGRAFRLTNVGGKVAREIFA
jgi:hypothetical protein